jgi:selenide,water dikinase
LEKWRITLHCGSPVVHVEAGAVKTARGEVIEANRVIWATTGAAPEWPKLAGLAADAKGFVAADATLRSTSNAEVFGGGDVVSIGTSPHPKSGVYAVRQAPVLAANLRAALTGGKLKTYVPQTHALSLISAGGEHAVATWGSWSVAGDWVWRWKDRIDRAFVAQYVAKYAAGYRNLPL